MHKIIILCLLTIDIALGKHELIITLIKNDREAPVRSRLVTAPIGANLTFHCQVTAYNNNNHTVIDTDVKWITTPSDNFKLAQNDSSILILSTLQMTEAGSYTCISKKQKLQEYFQLVVKPGGSHDLTRKRIDNSKRIAALIEQAEKDAMIDQAKLFPKLPDYLLKELNTPVKEFPKAVLTPSSKYPDFFVKDLDEPMFIPDLNFHNPAKDWNERHRYSRVISNSTYSNFKQSVYIVPVTILIMLGFVRLCYHIRNKSGIPWQPLSTPVCSHQLCAHRRRTDPSTTCILQRANASSLSVLIIHRATGASEGQSNNLDESDAPPAYNDLNCNDAPPTYNEALQSISTDTPPTLPTNQPA